MSNGDPSRFMSAADQMRKDLGPGLCLAKWKQVSLHLTTGHTNSCYHPPLHRIEVADIQDLQDLGILVSGVPIKLHTLHQKTQLIENSAQCLLHYNHWAQSANTGYALPYSAEHMTQVAKLEHQSWTADAGNPMSHDVISPQKLLCSDLKGFE